MRTSKIKPGAKKALSSNTVHPGPAVIPATDNEEVDETLYLLRSPANAKRLLKSINDFENGLYRERTLLKC